LKDVDSEIERLEQKGQINKSVSGNWQLDRYLYWNNDRLSRFEQAVLLIQFTEQI
jgi:hypothetical protein